MEENEEIKKIIVQSNYEELKKQSDLTEKFIKFADNIKLDDDEVPRTEKGMASKAKELIDKIARKMEKEEKLEKIVKTKKTKKEKRRVRKY